jgi:hypothetical protein
MSTDRGVAEGMGWQALSSQKEDATNQRGDFPGDKEAL